MGKKNKLIVFSAPSGSGKTTVVKHLMSRFQDKISFSVSATTRSKRPNELEGKDYYFYDLPRFQNELQNGNFVEYEEVYKGLYYGTLRSEVEAIWAQGKAVIFDVDVIGGLKIKEKFGDQVLAVFLKPPSLEILLKRLENRSTEVEHQLQERIQKAREELKFENQFDVIVVNDHLDYTFAQAELIVNQFLSIK